MKEGICQDRERSVCRSGDDLSAASNRVGIDFENICFCARQASWKRIVPV